MVDISTWRLLTSHKENIIKLKDNDINEDNDLSEKRTFPRMTVECPVLYRLINNKTWLLASLLDFSATGISIITEKAFNENLEFEFQIQPGNNKSIPALKGYGVILRCLPVKKSQFHLSCKLKKINRTDSE